MHVNYPQNDHIMTLFLLLFFPSGSKLSVSMNDQETANIFSLIKLGIEKRINLNRIEGKLVTSCMSIVVVFCVVVCVCVCVYYEIELYRLKFNVNKFN